MTQKEHFGRNNMKDFPFWRGAIYNAKSPLILKAIGEELSQFQAQSGLFDDEEPKLTVVQVATLRKQYSEKMKKFEAETMPPKSPGKSKFNKYPIFNNPNNIF